MKKKVCNFVVLMALMVVSAYGVFVSQDVEKMSDVTLMNLEALADNEELKPGNYNVYDEVTTFSVDGSAYKKTKIRRCEDGGKYECKDGNYYCYLKENGLWGEWIPA